MFEFILLMIAAAAQGAGGRDVVTGTAMIAAPDSVAIVEPAPTAPVDAPVFLAPEKPAAPAFLAPKAAAPVFLAPTEPTKPVPAAPAFLAPTAPVHVAEPQVATGKFTTALEVKPILNATRGNWVAVRQYDGQDLVYVTQLWAWRCGLIEMRVAVNGAPPTLWPMPDCHMEYATPNAILEGDGLPFQSYPPGTVAVIDVQVTYDDLTTDAARFERQAVLIP